MKLNATNMTQVMKALDAFTNMLRINYGAMNVNEPKLIQNERDLISTWNVKNNSVIDTIMVAIEDDGYVCLKINGGQTTYGDLKVKHDKCDNFIQKMQYASYLEWFDTYE